MNEDNDTQPVEEEDNRPPLVSQEDRLRALEEQVKELQYWQDSSDSYEREQNEI